MTDQPASVPAGGSDTDQAAVPWDAGRLAGVLTAVVYEHFTNSPGTSFTFCAFGRDEEYELLDPEDEGFIDDVLTFERTSDGARFHVDFWANVSAVANGGTDE